MRTEAEHHESLHIWRRTRRRTPLHERLQHTQGSISVLVSSFTRPVYSCRAQGVGRGGGGSGKGNLHLGHVAFNVAVARNDAETKI